MMPNHSLNRTYYGGPAAIGRLAQTLGVTNGSIATSDRSCQPLRLPKHYVETSVTNDTSIRIFSEKQMERQKEFGYHQILEALQRLEGFSLRSLVKIIESGEYYANQPQDVEFSDLTRQARTEIAQAVEFNRHVLSKTALDLMTAYQDELNDHLCRNWLERLEYNHNITRKYINLLATAAKQDLQSDA